MKKHSVKDCPYHANKDKILKRINELKFIHKLFSMKSETDNCLSSCSNFPERPSSYELESDKPVLPEIEHLKGKIGEGDFELLREVLNRNADVFSRHEEALSGVKASKARLLSEAEARRKDKPQELAAKKMQAVTGETREPEPATAAEDFKIDYKAAARDALNRVQQELVT